MNLSLLAIFILILSSCGRSPTGRAPSNLIGSQQQNVQAISGSQKNVALNICIDFKSKNINWRSNLLNKTFNFDIAESKCDETALPVKTVSTVLKGPVNSQAMIFDPPPSQSFPYKEVETDVFGVLADVCTGLIQGDTISNTVSYSDGSKIQLSFQLKSFNGFDGYSAAYFKANETTAWKQVVVELELDTANLPSPDYKGLEKVIRTSEICPSGDIASMTRTYLP